MLISKRRHAKNVGDYRKELQKAAKAVGATHLEPSHGAIAFFDLPGSTNLMNKDPRRAIPIMLLHNSMCRVIIEANGGNVVKELGDGLMVHFGNMGTAVSCAYKVVQNLLLHGGPIRTKVSIAVGTVWKIESRHGGYDVYGTPVHTSARMSEHARKNTILIDEREKKPVTEWLGLANIMARSEEIELRSYGPAKVCRISVKKMRA